MPDSPESQLPGATLGIVISQLVGILWVIEVRMVWSKVPLITPAPIGQKRHRNQCIE
jgi:hypothetical protein